MLRVTRREMEKAYRHHRNFCEDGRCPHLALLLVYSIECGLKALLMSERRVEAYEELPDTHRVKHDFVRALSLLHAPPELEKIGRAKLRTAHHKGPQETVLPKDLHQAFRYGVPLEFHA